MTPVRASANAVSKIRNVCRTGSLRMVGVVVLMYLALTLGLALPGPLSSQNCRRVSMGGCNQRLATWPVASPHGLRVACTAMQVVAAPARASARPSVRHSVPLPAPPPSTSHRLSSPKGASQPLALVTVWVQLVTDNQALGGPTKMSLEAQSDVDDLCSEVHAKFPQLTGISAAELIVSWEGAPLDPSNQWRRDAPLTDVRTTCDSPLYIHAPTTEVRRPAHTALHLARVAPGARTRGAARAIPCPPQPCTPPALLPRRRFCHVAPPRRALLP